MGTVPVVPVQGHPWVPCMAGWDVRGDRTGRCGTQRHPHTRDTALGLVLFDVTANSQAGGIEEALGQCQKAN